MGELAFDLPGSNVSKDDLPDSVKPGDAKGLSSAPAAKGPSIGGGLDKKVTSTTSLNACAPGETLTKLLPNTQLDFACACPLQVNLLIAAHCSTDLQHKSVLIRTWLNSSKMWVSPKQAAFADCLGRLWR